MVRVRVCVRACVCGWLLFIAPEKETATKLDILPVANLDVARAHVLRAELKLQRNFANLRSIDSIANKTALKILSLGGMEELVKRVTQFCNEVPVPESPPPGCGLADFG